jgi:hypothetical protein
MLPIASEIAVRNTTEIAASALPHAPVLPDPPPRQPRLRIAIAAFLRASAAAHSAGRPDRPRHSRPVTAAAQPGAQGREPAGGC